MKVISLVSQKGGSGKSTLAANLAAALHRQGKRVAVLDADPQGTLMDWQAVRAAALSLPAVTAVTTAKDMQAAIKDAAADYVVIDTPGRSAPLTAAAVALSNVALIVIQPSAPDVWASAATVEQVRQARTAGTQVEAAFVVNRVQANTRLAAEFGEGAWNDASDIDRADALIGNRTAFAVSFTDGLTVFDVPGSDAARSDITALLKELEAAGWL